MVVCAYVGRNRIGNIVVEVSCRRVPGKPVTLEVGTGYPPDIVAEKLGEVCSLSAKESVLLTKVYSESDELYRGVYEQFDQGLFKHRKDRFLEHVVALLHSLRDEIAEPLRIDSRQRAKQPEQPGGHAGLNHRSPKNPVVRLPVPLDPAWQCFGQFAGDLLWIRVKSKAEHRVELLVRLETLSRACFQRGKREMMRIDVDRVHPPGALADVICDAAAGTGNGEYSRALVETEEAFIHLGVLEEDVVHECALKQLLEPAVLEVALKTH